MYQENNYMIRNAVDEILINETRKVSAVRGASNFLDSGCGENDLYQVEKLVLKRIKKKLNDVNVRLNANIKFCM